MTTNALDTASLDGHTSDMDMDANPRATRVIPWCAMTDEQKRDHLLIAHGLVESHDWGHWDEHVWLYTRSLHVPHTHDKPARD